MEENDLKFTDKSNDQLESVLSGNHTNEQLENVVDAKDDEQIIPTIDTNFKKKKERSKIFSGKVKDKQQKNLQNTKKEEKQAAKIEEPSEKKNLQTETKDDDKRKVIIEVENLHKVYRVGSSKVHALNGVSFKVYEGEFCAIVGTSGSGKSTLLNMLAGLEKPTKGQIVIAGQHIEKMNEKKLVRFRRENVGFIFQSFNLLGTLNALENVALPLTFRGMPKALRLKKAMKMIKLVGLKEHAFHKPNQMSGGQQQRIGMARALVVDPKIMFADEPTGNLDSRTSKDMMNLMRNVVNKQKKTLVMVTHDDSLAAIADKVIRIVDGQIVELEDRSTKVVEESKNEKI